MAKKKNQIIISLGKVTVNNSQLKMLHDSIHKAVATKMKSINAANNKSDKIKTPAVARAAAPAALIANITVAFTTTIPGLSNLTATLKGRQKKLTQSGTVTFDNVRSSDIILIEADSLGSTTATIDISADPAQLNFPPGSHSDTFVIN